MKIEFNNVWAKVLEASSSEIDWLDEYTSCFFKSYRRSINYEPDQRYHMFDRASRLLPAGFVKLVRSAAKRDGIALELHDHRIKPCQPETDGALVDWLYDYQLEACMDIIRKGGRGLVKVPTGGGKTEIFIALTRLLPCEWLFVVHRADIIGQTARRFAKRTGERAGVWMNGRWQRGTSNVTLSTFQAIHTARKRKNPKLPELFSAIEAVTVDEVHAQPANTFYEVSLSFTNAYYRIGMSGTPMDRSDKENLRTVGALGPILYEVPYELLRDRGVLSQSHIRMARYKHPPTEPDAKWNEVYRDLIVRNTARNELLADMADMAVKPCLFFVEQMEHGRRMKHELELLGLRVDFATGGNWLDQRTRKLQALVDGEVDVLLCTVIFQEGIDIPSLRSVVVGNGKASIVAALQRIGRGMRTDAPTAKRDFEVWDVLDRGHRWLTEHATARKRAYEAAGHEVLEVQAGKLGKTG